MDPNVIKDIDDGEKITIYTFDKKRWVEIVLSFYTAIDII